MIKKNYYEKELIQLKKKATRKQWCAFLLKLLKDNDFVPKSELLKIPYHKKRLSELSSGSFDGFQYIFTEGTKEGQKGLIMLGCR